MDPHFAYCRGVTNDGRPQCKSKTHCCCTRSILLRYEPNHVPRYEGERCSYENSGLVGGGADTKLQAAMDLGIHVIVIDRPRVKIESHVVSSNDEFFQIMGGH